MGNKIKDNKIRYFLFWFKNMELSFTYPDDHEYIKDAIKWDSLVVLSLMFEIPLSNKVFMPFLRHMEADEEL